MAKKVKPGVLRGNTYENKLTADKNDHTLVIIGGMAYDLTALAQLIVKSGVTTDSAEKLVENFRLIMEKGIEMGLMGNNINFDFFSLRFGVKGVFNSPNEAFTRPKHEVTAIFTVGKELLDAMKQTAVTNMGPAQRLAQMETIINTVNNEVNLSLTPGQVLEIKGVNLTLLGDDPSVGIYLQEEGAADSARIKATTILNNEPKRLMFMVPATVAIGKTYRLVHITQAGASRNGHQLKEPRIEHSMPLNATNGDVQEPGGGDRPEIE